MLNYWACPDTLLCLEFPGVRLQSINCYVRSASAAHPNLELENPSFLGRKNEVSTTADMWLEEQIDFFHAILCNFIFP